MTVIAWDGTTLAADRQMTTAGYKQSITKIFRLWDGRLVGAAGAVHVIQAFVEWMRNKDTVPACIQPNRDEKIIASGLEILPDKTIHRYFIGISLTPVIIKDKYIAIGSGCEYAVGAMAAGASAAEAVIITNQHCNTCGMGVDALPLNLELAVDKTA